MQLLQVALEVPQQLDHGPQVLVGHQDLPLYVLFAREFGQRYGGLECLRSSRCQRASFLAMHNINGKWQLTVANLPPVPLHLAHLAPGDIILGVDIEPYRIAALACQLVDKRFLYLLPLVVGKVGVVQLHVDARDKGVVERPDPVSR